MKLLHVSLSVAALLTLVNAQSINNKIILPSVLSRNKDNTGSFTIGTKLVALSAAELDSIYSVYRFINTMTREIKAGYSVPLRTSLKMQPSGPALSLKIDTIQWPFTVAFDQMEYADDAVMRVRNAVVSELLRSTLPKQSSG